MKIHIHNIFRSASVLALTAFTFASCMQEEQPGESAVGYLCPPSVEIDVTLENLMKTKAVDMPVPADPYPETFRYVVKDNSDAVKYDGVGYWSPIVMPAANYSVEAYKGTNGFGEVYFYGKVEDTIAPADDTVPEIEVYVGNAILGVTVDTDFAKHFTITRVELSAPDLDPVVFSDSEAGASPLSMIQDTWYFVPSGVDITVAFEGVNSVGTTVNFTRTVPSSDNQPRSANMIVCKDANTAAITLPDQSAGAWATRLYVTPATFENISADNQAKLVYELIPEGGDWTSAQTAEQISGSYYYFKDLANGATYTVRARIGNLTAEQTVTVKENLEGVSIKSEHYKDGDGNLAGTNSTLTLPTLPGILGTLNTEGLLQITDYSLSNGTEIVRTAAEAGIMTPASGWPYLPQGSNYVLTINHKLNTPESKTVASQNTGFVSPSPKSFMSISLTSYSSYDKYLENNKDAANEMDAFTIKTLGAKWTIAPDLMNNVNYSKSFTYNNNGTSVSTYSDNTCSLGDKVSLAVGTKYEVSASVTFDDETVDTGKTKTHYITGLPYEGDFSDANKDLNWSQVNEGYNPIEFGGTYVKLMPGKAGFTTVHSKITSKQNFILPDNVNVHFYNVMKKSGSLLSGYKLLFGEETIKSINASVTVDESKNISAGTYSVVMDSSYGSSNRNSYYEVSSIVVNYGSLN